MSSTTIDVRELSKLYRQAHDQMRSIDGLQPQEAFDELLKYLFFKQSNEENGQPVLFDFALTASRASNGADTKAAGQIRRLLRTYIRNTNSWSTQLWSEAKFQLSDAALTSLHELFQWIDFSQLGFDIRSAALKTFLTPELRRGLGIFLTPDDVAKMVVEVVQPQPDARVYDPACGSGTFLIEVLNHWKDRENETRDYEVWASDVNPRMLLLAELNLGHVPNIRLHRQVVDALSPPASATWPQDDSFDVVFTNPPFGLVIDSAHYDFKSFSTCRSGTGALRDRQQSEVVFIEQCLRYLRPGGILAIVLPKSVITNATLGPARVAIDRLASLEKVVSLPAETFATAGTQTTTAVLFFRKLQQAEQSNAAQPIAAVEVKNVGFDATGRPRTGNELPGVSTNISLALSSGSGVGNCRLLAPASRDKSLSGLAYMLSTNAVGGDCLRLGDLVEFACTGKTAARSAYTEEGLFILKVGNLTGQGINWVPRDRNYVSPQEAARRRRSSKLMIRPGDIVLTASAHSPKYIAKKIDIITEIPDAAGGEATFVGEVMLLRPQKSIDAFALLAYLRLSSTVERLQSMIRGQTAHLMPHDVIDLEVPKTVARPNEQMQQLAELLRRQSEAASELSRITAQIEQSYQQFMD